MENKQVKKTVKEEADSDEKAPPEKKAGKVIIKIEGNTKIDPSVEERAESIFKDLLFDINRYVIRTDTRPVLDSIALFLNQETGIYIIIEGHGDERGSNEYNMALGEKRAIVTKKYLVALGVFPDRIRVISYGEEKPVCSQHTESCWKRNRRAHFDVTP